MRRILFAILSFGLLGGLLTSFGAHAAEREFYSGYIGTVPPAPADQAKTYFDRPEVRKLLAQMENGAVPEASAVALLANTDTQLADLIRLHLVRDDRTMLRLGFPYFTASDTAMIHAVAAKYVPTLVAAYQARQSQLNQILARYPVASVDRKRLAFVLIAGFGLNWDALDLLTDKKYRQPLVIQGAGWHYGFWASEDEPGYSYKGYYWGSSSFPADALNIAPPIDFTFSSFGDPYSDPRMNFPDLLAMPADQMRPDIKAAALALGLKDDDTLNMNLKNVVGLPRARLFGEILFAMRNGADTNEKICDALPDDQSDECDGALALLDSSGYIKISSDAYALRVPVFDTSDKPMLDAALALNRAVVGGWLAQNYTPMRRELLRLTAVRQGIPYPAMFGQIWHELFGLATRQLADESMIEDPYGPDSSWKGSIPVVWRTAIFHHVWE